MTDQDERSHRRPPDASRRVSVLARALSVMAFQASAALGLLAAMIAATEESYYSWSDPEAVVLLAMAGASVLAAGLAVVRRGGVLERIVGVALLVPAWLTVHDSSPGPGHPSGREQWLTAIAGWALVLCAGLIASGLPGRAFRRPG